MKNMQTVFKTLAAFLLVSIFCVGACFAVEPMADSHQISISKSVPVPPLRFPWPLVAAGLAAVALFGMAFQSAAQGNDINAVMRGWKDRGPWLYYDSIYSTGGALQASYRPFTIPIGGVDQVTQQSKTKLQTNMEEGGNFGSSRCLVLEQIGFDFPSNLAKADIDKILNNCYFEFKIEDKIYAEGLLDFFPSGTGLNGVTGTSGESTYFLGLPVPQYTRRWGNYSKYIAPLQHFSMTLYFPGTPPSLSTALGTFVWIRPILDGLTDRSVQ